MNSPAVELPLYQCHKQVRAAKITGIEPATSETTTLQFGDLMASTEVTLEWALKHKPQIGSYYVVYADGYTSCSPAQPFEEGYAQIINYTGPDAYKLRVRMEHDALEINIDRLELFLEKNSPQPNCPPEGLVTLRDLTHLNLQLDAMRLYLHILAERIASF